MNWAEGSVTASGIHVVPDAARSMGTPIGADILVGAVCESRRLAVTSTRTTATARASDRHNASRTVVVWKNMTPVSESQDGGRLYGSSARFAPRSTRAER